MIHKATKLQTVEGSILLSEDAVEQDISKDMCFSVDMGGGKSSCVIDENKSPTLTCTHYGEPAVAYGIEPGVAARVGGGGRIVEEATPTLRSNMGDNQLAVAYGTEN